MEMLSDGALAARCAALDEEAWRELLQRHQTLVARVLYRALGPRGAREVEDLIQDVYVRLLAHGRAALRRLRAERPGALAGFLACTARRVALDHLAGRPPAPHCDLDQAALLEDIARPSPHAALEKRRRSNLLALALLRLAEGPHARRDLAVLRGHFLQGLAAAEIARLPLGLAEDGVESLLRRTRKRLADQLRGQAAAEESLPAPRRSTGS